MYDICIVGGGASGMIAAIAAKQENPSIKMAVLEKNSVVGKKLSATGNGRCNITNINCASAPQTISFLENIGILTREEEQGRVYPYSGQAAEVVKAMHSRIEELEIPIIIDCLVEDITKSPNGSFVIQSNKGCFKAQAVLLATGGKAGPQFGATGNGYKWAKGLGHSVRRLAPVLTSVEVACNENLTKDDIGGLKGVRAKGRVTLLKNGAAIAEEQGEIQFTDKGISGVCVFNISRFVKLQPGELPKDGLGSFAVAVDFMPEYTEKSVAILLQERSEKMKRCVDIFGTVVHRAIGTNILKRAGLEPNQSTIFVDKHKVEVLAAHLKKWICSIENMGGWKNAQCTAGGIDLGEINKTTMQSLLVDRLYFAGEIIDYDGPCGGYNLQNAWETGIKAGMAIARNADKQSVKQKGLANPSHNTRENNHLR